MDIKYKFMLMGGRGSKHVSKINFCSTNIIFLQDRE